MRSFSKYTFPSDAELCYVAFLSNSPISLAGRARTYESHRGNFCSSWPHVCWAAYCSRSGEIIPHYDQSCMNTAIRTISIARCGPSSLYLSLNSIPYKTMVGTTRFASHTPAQFARSLYIVLHWSWRAICGYWGLLYSQSCLGKSLVAGPNFNVELPWLYNPGVLKRPQRERGRQNWNSHRHWSTCTKEETKS